VTRDAAKGRLKVLASDKLDQGSLEGIAPTLGLVDELHAHRNDAIYAAIQGALHKRGGQMATISTAGSDADSPLGRIRAGAHALKSRIEQDRLAICRSKRFVMFEWACRPDDDLADARVVKRANPASFVTLAKLRALQASPSMTDTRWARYHANLWVMGEGRWLEPHLWHACAGEIGTPEVPIVLGYDHARSYDHAALIALIPGEEKCGKVFPLRFFRPQDEDGGKVPFWKVKEAIRETSENYAVAAVGFDKLGGFAQSAEELADEGLPMVEVSMRSNVWGPLTAELRSAVKARRLTHPDDPELTAHVLAGEVKESEHGERLHGRTKGKVDGLIAMGVAWYVAFSTDALEPRTSVYEDRGLLTL
jgi:phage terminase large subunit-like protein